MKRIIDVDENLICEGFVRNFTEEEKDVLINAIRNSIPYEERPLDNIYSNSEITEAITNVISNKHDQHIIYSRLVCGKLWSDLFIFSKDSKRHYERLCLKVYKKLEEMKNDL